MRLAPALRLALLVVLSAAFWGCCWLPGDGLLEISGSLPSAVDETCKLMLIGHRDGEPYDDREVEADFEVSFIVAPCREDFVLELACPGWEPRRFEIDGSRRGPGPKVDLGAIVLSFDGASQGVDDGTDG